MKTKWFWGSQVGPWRCWGCWWKRRAFVGISVITEGLWENEMDALRAELIAALESLALTTCGDEIMYAARKRLEELKK